MFFWIFQLLGSPLACSDSGGWATKRRWFFTCNEDGGRPYADVTDLLYSFGVAYDHLDLYKKTLAFCQRALQVHQTLPFPAYHPKVVASRGAVNLAHAAVSLQVWQSGYIKSDVYYSCQVVWEVCSIC